jgi:transposase
MARVEVITGPERRRRWSAEQKRAIVAESLAPGAVVAEIARRADIRPGQIYRWRREIRVGNGFAQVLIAPVGDGVAVCPASPAIEIEFAGKARLRIPASIPTGLAAAVVKALSGR